MERVRMAHAPQVPVPPSATSAALELSREERHRLRVAKHQAFLRHQQNAAWVRDILQHVPAGSPTQELQPPVQAASADSTSAPVISTGSLPDDDQTRRLREQIALLEKQNQDLKSKLTREQEAQAEADRRRQTLMEALEKAQDAPALEPLRVQIQTLRSQSDASARPTETVRL